MSDYTATETCCCGASFTMRSEYSSDLKNALAKFRADHQHEMPRTSEPAPFVLTTELIGTHHDVGGTEMGLGFYPPSAQEIGSDE